MSLMTFMNSVKKKIHSMKNGWQTSGTLFGVIHRQICFVLSEFISVVKQYLPVAGIETRLNQTPNQSF